MNSSALEELQTLQAIQTEKTFFFFFLFFWNHLFWAFVSKLEQEFRGKLTNTLPKDFLYSPNYP